MKYNLHIIGLVVKSTRHDPTDNDHENYKISLIIQ